MDLKDDGLEADQMHLDRSSKEKRSHTILQVNTPPHMHYLMRVRLILKGRHLGDYKIIQSNTVQSIILLMDRLGSKINNKLVTHNKLGVAIDIFYESAFRRLLQIAEFVCPLNDHTRFS